MSDRVTKPALNATRRQFAAMTVVAAAATGFAAPAVAAPLGLTEKAVTVPADGGFVAGTMLVPEGSTSPGVVMYASQAAGRNGNLAVARQLASQGWAVLLVDAPLSHDPLQISRLAKANAAWLNAQPGVAKSAEGYTLRSFTAAFPKLSLAGREARRRAAESSALFAVPSKAGSHHDRFAETARALHRLAA